MAVISEFVPSVLCWFDIVMNYRFLAILHGETKGNLCHILQEKHYPIRIKRKKNFFYLELAFIACYRLQNYEFSY